MTEVEPAKSPEKKTKTFLQRLEDITFTGEYPEELADPISKELYEDPITVGGRTYDRKNLLKMFESTKSTTIRAPLDNKTIITLAEVLSTVTNFDFKAMVEKFVSREERLDKERKATSTNSSSSDSLKGSVITLFSPPNLPPPASEPPQRLLQ